MKERFMKRLFAVLLAVGMMVSCFAMASALELSDLIPTGSNPPSSSTEESTTAKAEETTSNREKARDAIKDIFIPSAPDQVVEAFGIADENYTKDHEYCFAVNTSQNIVIAYQQDEEGVFSKPVKAFICSCGKAESPTKKGIFRTSDTYRWRALNGGVYGQFATRITGHYLFHSVPYEKQDPSTLETAEYNKLGQNASAGCVRLAAHDAKWIMNRCPKGTIVYIYDGSDVREPLARPTAVKLNPNDPRSCWDPTDPSADNPWKA